MTRITHEMRKEVHILACREPVRSYLETVENSRGTFTSGQIRSNRYPSFPVHLLEGEEAGRPTLPLWDFFACKTLKHRGMDQDLGTETLNHGCSSY